MGYFRTTTYILAICLLYQALCGNEGSKWIEANLIDLKDVLKMIRMLRVFLLCLTLMVTRTDLSMDKALELHKPPPA